MNCEKCEEGCRLVLNNTLSHPYHNRHILESLPSRNELWIKNKYGRVAVVIRFDPLDYLQNVLCIKVARGQDVLVQQSYEHTLEGQVKDLRPDPIAAPEKIF